MRSERKFQVIRRSNTDEEGPRGDQYFMLARSVNDQQARAIAAILNLDEALDGADYYVAVFDSHKLQKFEP